MKVDLIRIGNSRGVRLPKPLIEQIGLGDKVELQIERNRIVISPQRQSREGWEAAFSAASPETLLLTPLASNKFDRKEWKW